MKQISVFLEFYLFAPLSFKVVFSIYLNTLRENTASHSKANNPYVVIDDYPSEVLIVLCKDEDGLLQYIYCAGKV